jgi:AcrR family transcriptional regulator
VALSTRKQRELQRREDEILSAALELFSGERWESVTVEQIAEKADVSKGTVYNHFGSKDEIYARLALAFFRGMLEGLQQMPVEKNPDEAIRGAFREALRYHIEHGVYRNVRQYVFRAGFWERLDSTLITEFEALDSEFRQWATALLEQGMATGHFRRESADRLITGLDALFNGAVIQLWGGQCWHEVDQEPYIESVIEFAMSGLRK